MKCAELGIFGAMGASCVSAAEPCRVDLVALDRGFRANEPFRVAFVITLEPGDHTYWENPGEAGMKPTVTWHLPVGWTHGELQFPIPRTFTSGDLHSYGYQDKVAFYALLKPPANAKGRAVIEADLSILVCNDGGCHPSDTHHRIEAVEGSKSSEPTDLERHWPLPVPARDVRLDVLRRDHDIELQLRCKHNGPWSPDGSEVFPATPQVLQDGAKIRFTKSADRWTATCPASEYLTGAPTELRLVFSEGPVEVTWTNPISQTPNQTPTNQP